MERVDQEGQIATAKVVLLFVIATAYLMTSMHADTGDSHVKHRIHPKRARADHHLRHPCAAGGYSMDALLLLVLKFLSIPGALLLRPPSRAQV